MCTVWVSNSSVVAFLVLRKSFCMCGESSNVLTPASSYSVNLAGGVQQGDNSLACLKRENSCNSQPFGTLFSTPQGFLGTSRQGVSIHGALVHHNPAYISLEAYPLPGCEVYIHSGQLSISSCRVHPACPSVNCIMFTEWSSGDAVTLLVYILVTVSQASLVLSCRCVVNVAH